MIELKISKSHSKASIEHSKVEIYPLRSYRGSKWWNLMKKILSNNWQKTSESLDLWKNTLFKGKAILTKLTSSSILLGKLEKSSKVQILMTLLVDLKSVRESLLKNRWKGQLCMTMCQCFVTSKRESWNVTNSRVFMVAERWREWKSVKSLKNVNFCWFKWKKISELFSKTATTILWKARHSTFSTPKNKIWMSLQKY